MQSVEAVLRLKIMTEQPVCRFGLAEAAGRFIRQGIAAGQTFSDQTQTNSKSTQNQKTKPKADVGGERRKVVQWWW